MNSNVTKYEVMISDALRSCVDVQRKQKSLEKANKLSEKRTAVLKQDCKKCFDEAVSKYNQDMQAPYIIFNTSIGIFLEKSTVSAEFELRYSEGGSEPDECFDKEDYEKIMSFLKPLVDEELKKQGIPFTFSSFRVPNYYYPK